MRKNRCLDKHDLPPTLTVGEVAELLNLGSGSVYKMIREGNITIIRFGRKILVPTAPLLKKLDSLGASIESTPPRNIEEVDTKASVQFRAADDDVQGVGRKVMSPRLQKQYESGYGKHQSIGEEEPSAFEKKAVEVLEKLDPDLGIAPIICNKRDLG